MNFNGYAYELEGVASECWADCADSFWDTVMVSDEDKRAIRELGTRQIDDATCMVFECADGRVRAVTKCKECERYRAALQQIFKGYKYGVFAKRIAKRALKVNNAPTAQRRQQ